MNSFKQRYGEWALITGASSGIGEAFAHAVAIRGVRPLLLARNEQELRRVAADILRQHQVASDILVADLADPAFIQIVEDACVALDVGLVISNAGFNPAGAFLDHSRDTMLRMLDVNCRASMLLAQTFLPRLELRGSGGFILVGSTEGFFGSPYSSVYSATKAFTLSFGEALWGEFLDKGIDVLVVVPGATDTPLLASRKVEVKAMAPRLVAETGLKSLGKVPSIVPSAGDRWAFRIMRRLPRRWMVRLVGNALQRIVLNLKSDGQAT